MLRLMFLGDVVGKTGRNVLRTHLRDLKEEHGAEVVIVNGENSAGGLGIDPGTAQELFSAGADILTSGNHVWNKRELHGYLVENKHRILRPANYPEGAPGTGWTVFNAPSGARVGIMNLAGRVFMTDLVDCPFAIGDRILEREGKNADLVIIDFHAEATSEKLAFGYHVDGRAALVVGTHTHVQTADERVLPNGTAYLSDAGMCGPYESVIGVDPTIVIERFRSGRPLKFEVAKGPPQINGLVVEADPQTGKASSITRISRVYL